VEGQATAYVCRDFVCQAAALEPEGLYAVGSSVMRVGVVQQEVPGTAVTLSAGLARL
jgi:hypothetical protein